MRLWSIHPGYLDPRGLSALWREGLLAQKVLQGQTKGYKNHPQLKRFQNAADPLGSIAAYLQCVAEEADRRGYSFNKCKIAEARSLEIIDVTEGQLQFEFDHLLKKLQIRSPDLYRELLRNKSGIKTHTLFRRIPGEIQSWEKP